MRHVSLTVKAVCLGLAILATACSGGDQAKNDSKAGAKKASTTEAPKLNIRYIDGDSIAEHYNLAKDYKDVTIRTLSSIDNAQRTKAAEIQKLATSIENKMRSNGYANEAEYNADMQRINKMQADAQNYIAGLQRNAQAEDERLQQQLNDSIQSFIEDYVKTAGYDAILYKAAGVYFNPALDITDEVIEGLNKRYVKVSDK